MLRLTVRTPAILGILLLIATIIGSVTSIRYDGLNDPGSAIHSRITLTPDQFLAESKRLSDESAKDYVTRITHAMHRTMTNVDLEADPHAFRVPFTENYLLFFLSFTDPEHFASIDLCDTDQAIERGVGLCSQQTITMLQIFGNNDIEAAYSELTGHVVVSVLVDEEKQTWWVLDPDSDVILPYSLAEIEMKPSLIRRFYEQQNIDAATIDRLEGIYGKEGNHHAPLSSIYFQNMCAVQRRSEQLIWIIPLILLLPWITITATALKRKRKASHTGNTL